MTDTASAETSGAVTGGPRTVLRLEGLALFIGMTLLYYIWDGDWWVYAVLFFVPDLSFAAYLSGPRFGALIYNTAHSYLGPVAIMTGAFATAEPLISLDRHDLAGPYRLRPRARLRPEIRQRFQLHPSGTDREAVELGVNSQI